MAGLYNNLGIVYLDKEDYPKAKAYYELYLQVAREANLTLDIIIAKMNLGELLARTGLFEEGLTMLHEALDEIKVIRNPELERSAYEVLDSVYEEKGDYTKALEYAEKTRQMQDSILNEENIKTLLEMETKFETEKKEQEIQLLTKDKSIKDLLISNQINELDRKKVMIWSSYGALTLFAGIIILVITSTNEKRKANLRLEEKNKELELQKNILEQKNNLIADSIEYARSIQTALQPAPEEIRTFAKGYWSYFNRESLLSTNAWEIFNLDGDSMFAFTQSSMEGVPGALISLNGLHRISNLLLTQPEIPLHDLHEQLRSEEKRKTILARRSKTTNELEVYGHALQCFIIREKTKEVVPIANNLEEVHFNIHIREGDLFCVFSNAITGINTEALPAMFSSPEKRSRESIENEAGEVFRQYGIPAEKIPMALIFKLF
jgi:tetratricopeptide (TPR) repeat protein